LPAAVSTGESGTAGPTSTAGAVSFVLVAIALLVAALIDKGDGFTPRVDALDALAGLTFGAFIVDRLLTFVPPLGAAKPPAQRTTDLTVLRIGYGALLGAIFVILTDLRAVHALSPDSGAVSAWLDRDIAVLAIAGGVAGLSRLLSGINPQPATDGKPDPNQDDVAAGGTIKRPSGRARAVGLALVGVGALIALFAINDKEGVNLLAPSAQADGTVGFVVRFGLVFLGAGIVQQIMEWCGRVNAGLLNKSNRPVVLGGLAVVFGVVGARVFDLFLLHNIGFFGTTGTTAADLNTALQNSSHLERWADTFFTGLVIAAGTKPAHDIASRLRKAQNTRRETPAP